jgi:hypothetical protein
MLYVGLLFEWFNRVTFARLPHNGQHNNADARGAAVNAVFALIGFLRPPGDRRRLKLFPESLDFEDSRP